MSIALQTCGHAMFETILKKFPTFEMKKRQFKLSDPPLEGRRGWLEWRNFDDMSSSLQTCVHAMFETISKKFPTSEVQKRQFKLSDLH